MNKPLNEKNEEDAAFMRRALDLARRGGNQVSPNPLVGAVLVKNGKIVGEGWHASFGKPHAEVNALRSAGNKASGADLYVTLEPCSTFGKTPPCVDQIVSAKIKRVIFGAVDANPKNSNRALPLLKKQGIEARFLDFQREHEALNPVFLHALKSDLPYVQLKAAISMDGKLRDSFGKSQWITGDPSRQKAQHLRRAADGILIGANTFNSDNPLLSLRPLPAFAKEPSKILLSASGRLNPRHNLLRKKSGSRVIICTTREGQQALQSKVKNPEVLFLVFSTKNNVFNLREVLKKLKALGQHNILVEGGAALFSCFMRQKPLFQELHLFLAPKVFGGPAMTWTGDFVLGGVSASSGFELKETEKTGDDVYLRYSCSPASSRI